MVNAILKTPTFYIRLTLCVVITLGIYLRASHLYFGLPERYHPDEHRAAKTVRDCFENEYKIAHYNHPPLIKNMAIIYLKVWGIFRPVENNRYYLRAVIALRQVSFLCGVLAVLCVYLLGRHFLPPWYAVGAALIYAVFPVTVFSAKYGLPDMLLSLLVLIALINQMRLYDAPSKKRYFLNGFLCVLACTAKYNGAFLFVSFGVTHLLITKNAGLSFKKILRWHTIVPFAAGAILGGSIGFPVFQIADKRAFINSFIFEFQHLFVKGHGMVKMSGGDDYYVFHWMHSVLPAAGIVLLVTMVVGVLLIFFKVRHKGIILMSFTVPYYITMEYIFKVAVNYERYVLPLLGVYIICAFFACKWISECIARRMKISSAVVAGVLFFAVCCFPAYRTIRLLDGLEPDTREQAKQWIQANIPKGSKFLLQWPLSGYYPDLKKIGYTLVTITSADEDLTTKIQASDYIIVSSLCYDRYLNTTGLKQPIHLFYESLFNTLEPIYESYPSYITYMVHNPTIKVYKVVVEKE